MNRLSGSYALIDNGSIVLGDLMSTRMAGPPERMELERELSTTLATINAFHVQGNQLQLLRNDEIVAEFQVQE